MNHIHGTLNNSEYKKALKRLQKKIKGAVKPLNEIGDEE